MFLMAGDGCIEHWRLYWLALGVVMSFIILLFRPWCVTRNKLTVKGVMIPVEWELKLLVWEDFDIFLNGTNVRVSLL